MERNEAVLRLQELVGRDLLQLAQELDVTVWKDGKRNKGWAGHVIERYLGLQINSAQAPNFGSWELKQVSLNWDRCGRVKVKETMAITMIDPVHVKQNPFETSHLLSKLTKAVLVARTSSGPSETESRVERVVTFDLDPDTELYKGIKADYEEVRRVLHSLGFQALTGRMGVYVQPRTKGPGHGSISRAFYARKRFVELALGLTDRLL